MKTMHAVLGGVLAVGVVTSAWAGYRNDYPVVVDTTYREARGSLGSARASADSTQYIGCSVYSYATGGSFMYCNASSASNSYGSCTSSDPILMDAARSVKDGSYVYFGWDAGGNCQFVHVVNTSYIAPKAP